MTTAAFDSSIGARMVRAARCETALYEEVEHDRGATGQAALVVVLTSIAAGVGALGEAGLAGLLITPVAALIGWAAYAWITYFVGTRLLAGPDTTADWGELARALGFASSPRALLVLGFIPVVGVIVALAVFVWTLVTTVIAVRAALDFDAWRAVVTAVAGWIVYGLLVGGVVALLS